MGASSLLCSILQYLRRAIPSVKAQIPKPQALSLPNISAFQLVQHLYSLAWLRYSIPTHYLHVFSCHHLVRDSTSWPQEYSLTGRNLAGDTRTPRHDSDKRNETASALCFIDPAESRPKFFFSPVTSRQSPVSRLPSSSVLRQLCEAILFRDSSTLKHRGVPAVSRLT
ncbi:hypothetical protein F4859DRAFT_212822 [Xylaria cf. heliscus]|nr:hypothetical protein F4859DRAFT_212822 [Xylaria cf. heliscus]